MHRWAIPETDMKDWSDRESSPGDRTIPFEFSLLAAVFIAGLVNFLASLAEG